MVGDSQGKVLLRHGNRFALAAMRWLSLGIADSPDHSRKVSEESHGQQLRLALYKEVAPRVQKELDDVAWTLGAADINGLSVQKD